MFSASTSLQKNMIPLSHLENTRICLFFLDISLWHPKKQQLVLSLLCFPELNTHYHPAAPVCTSFRYQVTSLGSACVFSRSLIFLECFFGRAGPGWVELHMEGHFLWAELVTTRAWFGDALPTASSATFGVYGHPGPQGTALCRPRDALFRPRDPF